ncbi:MAG TPA: NAD-dependent epimerase/dehydratase family protein [Vicinamibacterales bacterium]|nr:NAD-dependent epimerase/dehydratase family protein [Vicinamibacterales bacterium]
MAVNGMKDARDTEGSVARAGKVVRVAIVGCGAAARELQMPVLAGHERVEVTALVDRDLDRARQLATQYKVSRVFEDSRALQRDFVDGVILCTPPSHHGPGSAELAQRGFHVLVEKPLATRYEDAVAAVRAAEQAGVVLAVSVFRRLLPSTRMLRGLIDAKVFGSVQSFDVDEGEVYGWPAATLANMQRNLAGGGVLIDFGSHSLDRLTFLFPGPASVLEYRDNARGGIESDCELRLRLTTAAGEPVEGRLVLSRTRNLRNSYRIYCERGMLELPSNERFKVHLRPSGPAILDVLSDGPRESAIEARWTDVTDSIWYEAFRAQIDDFVEAVSLPRPSSLSGASVLPALRLIQEAYAKPAQPLPEPWADAGLRPGPHHSPRARTRRVLVTGATGFVGGRVAEILSLREGWDVRALVHNPSHASRLARLPVDMVMGDLGSERDVARIVEGCDAVVHCAIGNAWGASKTNFDVTVRGTERLTAAALAQRVSRFVHLSTFAVHDLSKPGALDESSPVNPPAGNEYSTNKAQAEQIIRQAAGRGLAALTLRLANVYGPFSTIHVTRPITSLARGQLVLVGDPAAIPSSTVHVDSVVNAIVLGLEAPADAITGELFTISDGDDFTWADFFGYFSRAIGIPYRTIADAEFQRRQQPDTDDQGHWLLTPFRSIRDVATSPEAWAMTKRILKSEPVFSAGKWTMEHVGFVDRAVRGWLELDAPVIYRRVTQDTPVEAFEYELTRPKVAMDKAARVLGYQPAYPRETAMELTLEWLRDARVVQRPE